MAKQTVFRNLIRMSIISKSKTHVGYLEDKVGKNQIKSILDTYGSWLTESLIK